MTTLLLPVERVDLALPLPPPEAGGNDRGHSIYRSKVRKWIKQDAYLVARSVMAQHPGTWEPWTPVVITYRWVGKTLNMPDPDNVVSRAKPVLDGIVEAGLIADDSRAHVSFAPVVYEKDKDNPRLVVEIERVMDRAAETEGWDE